MRTRFITLAAACATLAGCGSGGNGSLPQLTAATPATRSACESLQSGFAFADTTITAAALVAAGTLNIGGTPIAEHCRVTGSMLPRTGPVDSQPYAIGFEMRLPTAWNGRFYHQVNGGLDGSVLTAQGALGGGPTTGALAQGFAVISSNAGHAAPTPFFGLDPQARLDYGYQAVGKLTPMAKALILAAYGKRPDRSYIGGCSNGGRHTFVAAARYANEYDGFLAGAPGYRLPRAAIANIYGAQRYASIATDPADLSTAFTTAERQLVAGAVLAKCDALDGATDGLVQDGAACQGAFSLERDVPTCAGARDGSCLSAAQKSVIARLFAGAVTSSGSAFYSSFPYDAGIATADWASWKFTAPLQRDSGAVAFVWQVPPAAVAGFNGSSFALTSNIDDLLAKVGASNATYTEPALSFMLPPDGGTNLGLLKNRGAKMIVYHGVSDPIFSADDTIAWYRGLQAANGGDASDFARYYPVPGMNHCSRGPATDQFDLLTPLVDWVEQGRAPQAVVASARGAGNAGGVNADVPAGWSATRTRPLCPYPQVARYNGSGSLDDAASFSCR